MLTFFVVVVFFVRGLEKRNCEFKKMRSMIIELSLRGNCFTPSDISVSLITLRCLSLRCLMYASSEESRLL